MKSNYLKDVLKKNSFPTTLVEKCVKIFLNRTFEQKIVKHTVPKKGSFTLSLYVFPVFENTLTKKHQQEHFILQNQYYF